MSDDAFDFDDADFLSVEKSALLSAAIQAPVTMAITRARPGHAPKFLFSIAADVMAALGANRLRIEWNRLKGLYRLRSDDLGPYEIGSAPRTDRAFVRVAFPTDDLYEAPGRFAAEYRHLSEHKALVIKVPAVFMTPPPPEPKAQVEQTAPAKTQTSPAAPRPAAPPRLVAERRASAEVPLDDPKVVRAALGLTDDPPRRIAGQSFTHAEACVIDLLAKREQVTKEAIMWATADPASPDDDRDIKLADVLICKVRPRLKAMGVNVETLWGAGYGVSSAERSKLSTFIKQAAGQ